tara:strand:- start:282 stop:950 length:669 start_codon:yes stop_codon:yes gene_type:complete
MANRATQIVNFYETTITNSDFSAGATSFTVATAPTTNGSTGISSASTGNEDTWVYLVIDPDSSSNREIVVVKTHSSGSTTFSDVLRDYDGRQQAGGAPASTGIAHGIGTTVRLAVLAQHIQDQNDRVATNITSLTTAITNFNTNSAAAITTFNTNGTTAINNINASSATAMINGATNGTSVTVDIANDFALILDATDTVGKKVKVSQIAPPVEVHPFLTMGG